MVVGGTLNQQDHTARPPNKSSFETKKYPNYKLNVQEDQKRELIERKLATGNVKEAFTLQSGVWNEQI